MQNGILDGDDGSILVAPCKSLNKGVRNHDSPIASISDSPHQVLLSAIDFGCRGADDFVRVLVRVPLSPIVVKETAYWGSSVTQHGMEP